MMHQILIASYAKDFRWLSFCLASLYRRAEGFLPPVVVVPPEDEADARLIAQAHPGAEVRTKAGEGFARAQIVMMQGDIFCPDADYIYLLGSDCFAVDRVSPEDYFDPDSGLPIMLHTSYEYLRKHVPGAIPWQDGCTHALGVTPQFEYMRRLPIVYPKALFKATREAVEACAEQNFEDYVTGAVNFRKNFSESNVLGLHAHRFFENEYYWHREDTLGPYKQPRPNPIIQFWSHGGLDFVCDHAQVLPDRTLLKGNTPRKIINRYL